MATFSATARIHILVEVDAGSSWGPDCTVAQVRKQAGEEALARLTRTLRDGEVNVQIVGAPRVIAVMHGETQDMRHAALSEQQP